MKTLSVIHSQHSSLSHLPSFSYFRAFLTVLLFTALCTALIAAATLLSCSFMQTSQADSLCEPGKHNSDPTGTHDYLEIEARDD